MVKHSDQSEETIINENFNTLVPHGGFPNIILAEPKTEKNKFKINARGFSASKKISLNDLLNKVPDLPGGTIEFDKISS